MNAGNWFDAWKQDMRYAVRSLATTPLFTLVAIATLAIGTGATTAIFSTVNATLLRPLPYPEFERLVDGRTRLVDGRVTTGLVSHVELLALAKADIVAQAAGVSAQPFNVSLLRDDGTPVNATLSGVTNGFFGVVGLSTVLGRSFTPEEHQPAAGPNTPIAVVIADRAWSTFFNRDPGIVGKTVRLAEMPAATVVGVAAPALDIPHDTDFWFNVRLNPLDETHFLAAIVRLKPGATLDQLRAAGEVALSALRPTVRSVDGRAFVLRPLLTAVVGDLGPTLLIVLGATALLLVLAFVNVTNLLLARGLARTRDIALRSALGATRGQIVRQLLTESMVLALAGTLAGLALGFGAVRLLLTIGASSLPRLDYVPFDGRVLVFAIALLLVGGLVTGAAPAWRLARPDIRTLLNAGGRTSTATRGTSRLMSGLIVAEVALAIALVAGSAWLVQSFARLQAIDPGFRAAGRLVVDVRATRRFDRPGEAFTWSSEVVARVRSAAGDAAVGSGLTFPTRLEQEGAINVELQSEAPEARARGANVRAVSPGFFEAMGTPLVAGRFFTDDDRQGSERVVIVNRAFVRQFFPDADPLANAIAYGYPKVNRQNMSRVVGVIDDVRYKSLAEPGEAAFYTPMTQAAFPMLRQTLVIAPRAVSATAVTGRVREELLRFDPQVMLTFAEAPTIVAASLVRQRLGMTLMLIFGATALALAAIGIYGVMAYATAQRAGEIATRLALGEAPRGAFWLVMRNGQTLTLAGLAIGLAVAYAAGRIVAANVFEMRAADPIVLLTAATIVGGVAAIATMIPAVRASRLSPVRALRNE